MWYWTSLLQSTAPFNNAIIHVYALISGHDEKMRLTTSDNNYRKQKTKNQIRTFWLYDWNVKLERMRRQTGETFIDPTAMLTQMRETSNF